MLQTEIFAHLGLYIKSDFLDFEFCQKLYSEMLESSCTKAGIFDGVNEEVRRVKRAEVSENTNSLIQEHLQKLKPLLENHFNLPLEGFQDPNFLVYREGDFYSVHKDQVNEPSFPDYAKVRKISVVIFLNQQVVETNQENSLNTYSGGDLVLYGLMPEEKTKHLGFPLMAEPGLLVAFRSETVHEVKPVIQGTRCTIVTWFF